MIRVVLFLIAVALIATGVAWFADRPGDVVLTWMGYRVETSLMVAALAVLVFAIVLMLVWSILRGIVRTPEQVSLFFRHRRAMKGYAAISRGLIAIGAGDLKLARRVGRRCRPAIARRSAHAAASPRNRRRWRATAPAPSAPSAP